MPPTRIYLLCFSEDRQVVGGWLATPASQCMRSIHIVLKVRYFILGPVIRHGSNLPVSLLYCTELLILRSVVERADVSQRVDVSL